MCRAALSGWLPSGRALAAPLISMLTACFIFNHKEPQRTSVYDVPENEVALAVTNHNYLDVVIYVRHDGQETRVGTVTGSSSEIFYLPARLLGMGHEIQLLGHPIGGTTPASTPTILVQPGQYIEWTLETDLRRSSVGVF
jgi:hypothetical protein